jgi:hypothetical protein
MGRHSKPNPSEVPQTITDDQWERIQRGAPKVVPVIETPWSDPGKVAKLHTWRTARDNAGSN